MHRINILIPLIAASALSAGTVSETVINEVITVAQSSDPIETAKSLASGTIDAIVEEEVSSWLSNTEVSITGVSKRKPSYGLLTVQPFYEIDDFSRTVFGQFSLFGNNGRTTLNAGSGYRYLTPNEHWLFGVNAFYDHEFPYGHQRISVGLEARSSVIELNANQYKALSGWKTGANSQDEHALDGIDIEVGFTLPFLPGSKLYHKTFQWDTLNGLTPIKGKTTAIELSGAILPGLVLELGSTDYDARTDREYVQLTYTFRDKPDDRPFLSSKAYDMRSMKDQRLKKVRRENMIMKQTGGGLTIAFR